MRNLLSLLLLTIVLTLGCGGGTTGTGSYQRSINGILIFNDGQPAAGAEVLLTDSDLITTTAADGRFTLVGEGPAEAVFRFKVAGAESEVAVSELDESDGEFDVSFTVDEVSKVVTLVAVEIIPNAGDETDNNVVPSPTPQSTPGVSPTPNQSPTPTPPAFNRLTGTVSLEDGAPVKDIRIDLLNYGLNATTSSSGVFNLKFPKGRADLSVKISGTWFLPQVYSFKIPEKSVTIKMKFILSRLSDPQVVDGQDLNFSVELESLTVD